MRTVFARARALPGAPLVSVCVLVCAASCGGTARNPPPGAGIAGGPGPGGGGSSGGGTFVEAPHSPLPQLVFRGGPILTAPEIVTVTFAGDPNADALEAFDDDLVTSAWWSEVTADFCDPSGACVARGYSGGHVRLTTAPAASYTDSTAAGPSSLQLFIEEQIGAGLFPPVTPNTLYVLYFPASTVITVTEGNGQTVSTCTQFHGYHNAIGVPGGANPVVPYAVVQECPQAPGSSLSSLQALTYTASHEILEGVTDPVQTTKTHGFYLDLSDRSVLGWNLLSGGEAGDLCADTTGLGQDRTVIDGYTVERIWSNASAAQGLDPCVPVPAGDVYFNVAPKQTSSFIVLSVGGTTTFEADAFSTGATSPWTLSGIDWATQQHLLKSPLVSFLFNGQKSATVNNGDKVEVTVSLDADPAQLGGAEAVLVSTRGPANAPTAAHTWPILVVTPSESVGGL